MSRIAKSPVTIPKGVEVTLGAEEISVKGSRGVMSMAISPEVTIAQADGQLTFAGKEGAKNGNAIAGTVRTLVNNMVIGTSEGFEKKLQLVGVGYRTQVQGQKISLSLGFSHPVEYNLPEGVKAEATSQTDLVLKASDKQLLGQVAAEIRAFRPPEPYKGKGVRYADEQVHRKEAKKK